MEILTYPFFQNALIALLLISVVTAIIGTYIVTRRMVFIAGGITHACFGGLGFGYFLGFTPIGMAAVFGMGSALAARWMQNRAGARSDSAIAVIWALGMALGILFIALTPGYVPELNSFLFGNVLTVTYLDLWIFGIFAIVVSMFFVLFRNLIVAISFDADFSRTAHLPVSFIDIAMTCILSLGIVLTIKLIGIMLLMSMISLPQMTAELHIRRYLPLMITSGIICAFSSVAGLFLAYFLSVPASATIVLQQIAIYAVAVGYKKIRKNRIKI